jgi:hypothetical protein
MLGRPADHVHAAMGLVLFQLRFVDNESGGFGRSDPSPP